jgi:hypothetical protein
MILHEGLVFGMTWRPAISDDPAELLALSKELDANCYVEAAFDVKHKYGFVRLKRLDNAQSAAVVFGQILESGSGILVHQLTREMYCFIAVRDRLPVQDCDIVGTRDEVISAAKAYAAKARSEEGIAPKFYGDVEELISGAIAFELKRLVDEADEIGKIRRVRSLNAKAAFIACSVLLLAGAWFAPDLMQMSSDPQIKIDPKEEHRKAVAAAIDNVVGLKQFPQNVMPGYIKFATEFPAEVARETPGKGWKLENLVCDGTDCTANWKRLGSATNKDFLDALGIQPGDVSISFPGVDVISRKVTFVKNETPSKLVLGTQLKFGETVLSWLQTLADRPRTDPLAPMVPTAGNFTLEQADMPLAGSYSFTVPYSELSKVATLPNVLTIERITLTYKDPQNIKFEFQGKYYAL